ncbi:MAG: FAD-dependent oxidoreductase [Aeropyrum sp.]|nr:FAD-dependent oxidoreductase [Aeropyrum sp.]MCE4616283.1 FAD-dependent oxidoreductase [Aeropyrum sp.]
MKFLRCKEIAPSTGKLVSIIGAGPAGLGAAGYLRCRGHDVIVYEMLPEPGGMMMFGIPDDRIPKDNIRKSVKELMEGGVKIMLNTKVGKDISLDEIINSSDAVLIATGTWKPRKLGAPGEDLPWVVPAADWLVEVHLARYGYLPWAKVPKVSGTLLVVGGGLTAADAVHVPLTYPEFKDGVKKVVLSYRRTRDYAPMRKNEFERLVKMGAEPWELTQPIEFYEENGKRIVRLIRMKLEAGDSGRPRPVPVEGSEFEAEFDWVLLAIGEVPTPPFSNGCCGIELNPDGSIKTDENFMTTRTGVFAAGDVRHGPSLIGKALKSGLDAAAKVHQYLSGQI